MRRPSAALLVALTALFVALAGSATAAVLITSAQIKNGTIQLVDISPGARAALHGQRGPRGPRGAQGPQGAAGPQGATGPAGTPATRLFAVVNADGTVFKGSGATSVAHPDSGQFTVTFNRDVDDCAAVASVGGHGGAVQRGAADATTSGNDVLVTTLKLEFSGHLQLIDTGFHLAVFC